MFEIKTTNLGSCGKEHASFDEWQECKACDMIAAAHNKTEATKIKMSAQIKRNEDEHDRIWNAAIEAAAKYLEKDGWITVPNIVRELKK